MAYEIRLDGVLMPVAPGNIGIQIENKNSSLSLATGKEFTILKDRGAKVYSFDLLLPQREYPFAQYEDGFIPAVFYIELLQLLKAQKRGFILSIKRMTENGQRLRSEKIRVSMEDLSFSEDSENGLDVMASLKLKEFEILSTKVGTVKLDKKENRAKVYPDAAKRNSNKTSPKTYVVKRGDTLWGICKKYLGSGEKYPAIAKLNKIKNPNLIYPGMVIRLE